MSFLTTDELTAGFEKAKNMAAGDVTLYLSRANAFCFGEIGGTPPTVDENLKTAVVAAFEILTRGETAQVDPTNGNVTAEAPLGAYNRPASRMYDPLDTVRAMLRPYKLAFEAANAAQTDKGARFM